MAGNRYCVYLILGVITWLAAACSSTPAPKPEPAEQQAAVPESIYLELSEADRAAANSAVQQALETTASNKALTWNGPDGVAGLITPLRTFKIKTGHFCRDFTEAILRDAIPATAASRACRTTEGRWLRVPIPQVQE